MEYAQQEVCGLCMTASAAARFRVRHYHRDPRGWHGQSVRAGAQALSREARDTESATRAIIEAIPDVLCDSQGLDALDFRLDSLSRIPEDDGAMRIEPELRRIAEQPRQAQGHRRTDRPPAAQQLVDRLAGDAQSLGKTGDREPVVGQEVLAQHLAWMGGPAHHLACVRNAHLTPRPSVVVRDLDVIGIAVDEPKADTPLVVDGDRVLPFAITLQLVQPIAGRHPEVVQASG